MTLLNHNLLVDHRKLRLSQGLCFNRSSSQLAIKCCHQDQRSFITDGL